MLVLIDPDGAVRPVPAKGGLVEGVGVLDPSQLAPGQVLGAPPVQWRVAAATPDLLQRAVERATNVVQTKDAGRILTLGGIGPGGRVLEAGVGSGALTAVLAWAVGPTGRVIGMDLRDDHLGRARRNLERLDLADRTELRAGDVTDVPEDLLAGLDALVLDVPDPGPTIAKLAPRLPAGARVVAYAPQVTQARDAAAALEAAGAWEVTLLELLERRWAWGERVLRPAYESVAHTGFLVGGILARPSSA